MCTGTRYTMSKWHARFLASYDEVSNICQAREVDGASVYTSW